MIVPKIRGEYGEYKQLPDIWLALSGAELQVWRNNVELEINAISFLSSACMKSWRCGVSRFNGSPRDIFQYASSIAFVIGSQLGIRKDQWHDARSDISPADDKNSAGQKCSDERHVMSDSSRYDRKRWSTYSLKDLWAFMGRAPGDPACSDSTLGNNAEHCGGACLKTIPQASEIFYSKDTGE